MIMPKAFLCALLLVATVTAQPSIEDLLESKTLAAIADLDRSFDGAIGVAALDLTTGRTLAYHGETVFAQASSIKIPILMRAFQAASEGRFSLDDQLALTAKDTVGGSGQLQRLLESGPVSLSIRDLLTAMIRDSDNVATNRAIALVDMASVNRMLDELGFLNTRLRRIMIDSGAARRNLENVSTPLEMVRLVRLLHDGNFVSPRASEEMIAIMTLVDAAMRKTIPEEIRVASKPGGVPGVQCETGIVYLRHRPFALSVMSAAAPEGAASPVGGLTTIVLRHFQRLASINAAGHRVR
jgi:beta-lactamase class A